MSIKGNLVVLSGPSGTGKGTVCKGLFQELDKLHLSISATTRQPRGTEQHGREYFFLDQEQFELLITDDQLLEYANVYGDYYGTPRQPVLEALHGGLDVLLEIDVQGGLRVKDKYPSCVLIFLMPPSRAELARRLKNRCTDSDNVIIRRLHWAEGEIEKVSAYDYVVLNDDLAVAIGQVSAIIRAERCRSGSFDMDLFWQQY
jgi:guanylate kinase